jgi:hypothetical protein
VATRDLAGAMRDHFLARSPIFPSSGSIVPKVSGPNFLEKIGNSPNISKGISRSGMWGFESSQVSQPVRRQETLLSTMPQRPANGGLLRIGYRSPGPGIGVSGSKIADSLRRIFEIFPFSGDWDRRPGSICTAWPGLQCKLRLCRREIGNLEPALRAEAVSRFSRTDRWLLLLAARMAEPNPVAQ